MKDCGIIPSPKAVAELLQFAINISIPGFKHDGFLEEEELRLFTITEYDDEAKKGMTFTERNGLLIPHIPLAFKNGKLPIREIYVGPRLDYKKAEWSLIPFLEQNGYKDVKIRQSRIPYLP